MRPLGPLSQLRQLDRPQHVTAALGALGRRSRWPEAVALSLTRRARWRGWVDEWLGLVDDHGCLAVGAWLLLGCCLIVGWLVGCLVLLVLLILLVLVLMTCSSMVEIIMVNHEFWLFFVREQPLMPFFAQCAQDP